MDTFQLQQAVSAPGLFYSDNMLVDLYVDDIKIVAEKMVLQNAVKIMEERFSTKGDICGDEFTYVGVSIRRNQKLRQIYIDQSGYIRKVLAKFDMLSCRGRAMPIEPSIKLRTCTEEEEAFNTTRYREAIGCLLYIALSSRPDITYTVGVLGRFSANPSIEHWTAVKHVLRYLKATLGLSLPLIGQATLQNGLLAFADADFAGDPVASKSTSGYAIYADRILVLWKSKKQGLVAQSTMEAELVSAAEAWKNLQWFNSVLHEIGHFTAKTATPTILNDNQSCIQVLNSGNFSSNSRHMRLRFHHLVDCIARESLNIRHIPTVEMCADGLTKALGGVKHREFVRMMGLDYV